MHNPEGFSVDVQSERTSQERKENRITSLIEKNHAFAVAAYELEEKYAESEELDFGSDEVQKILSNLPTEVAARFKKAIRKYDFRKLRTTDAKEEIQAWEDFYRELGVEDAVLTQELGFIVYRGMTKSAPAGKVTFYEREGYFIMSFADPKDYARILQVNDTKVQDYAGTYHCAERVPFFKTQYEVPIIMVREDLFDQQTILTHERQHFINEGVLNNFNGIEFSDDTVKGTNSVDRAMRPIKDEVLAYLREGASGDRLVRALKNDIYKHLFKSLDIEDQTAARDCIEKTADFITDHKELLKREDIRAVIVYQLAAVPFQRFPAWLEALDLYYSQREVLLKQFLDIADTNSFTYEGVRMPSSAFSPYAIPSGYNLTPIRERNRDMWSEMKALYGEAKIIVFNHSISLEEQKQQLKEIYKKYADLVKQLGENLAKIKQRGAYPPYTYGMRNSEKTPHDLAWNKATQRLLDAVDLYPQEEIDKLFKLVKNESSERPAFVKKITSYLKKHIDPVEGGQRVLVLYQLGYDKDTADIVIHMTVPVETEDRKYNSRSTVWIHCYPSSSV